MNGAIRMIGVRMVGVLALLLCFAGVGRAAVGDAIDGERWYELTISGERSGCARFALSTADNGDIQWTQQMEMRIKRLGEGMTITITTTAEETKDGVPLRMRSEQALGAGKQTTSFEFKKDGIEVTVEAPGGRQTRTEPLPTEEWLTPMQARRFTERMLAEGAGEFSYKTIDPSAGTALMTVTQKKIGATKVTIGGMEIDGVEWEMVQSIMPGVKSREVSGADGWPIRSVTPVMGFEMVMTLSTKDAALAGGGAAELMEPMLITPSAPMKDARTSERAVFVVRSKDGSRLGDLPSTGAQRAQRIDEQSIRVTLDLKANAEKRPGALARLADPAVNNGEKAYLQRCAGSSALINSESACVKGLLTAALKDVPEGADALARATAMRHFVGGYMTGAGLSVGMAGSDEVCRTKSGDCTEYAVLLAAMLRANGIPSRVVCGLLYCDTLLGKRDVFGPHMWTQALVKVGDAEQWIDLDGALGPGERRFDAGHIAFSTTVLSDEAPAASFLELVSFLGGVTIEVVQE